MALGELLDESVQVGGLLIEGVKAGRSRTTAARRSLGSWARRSASAAERLSVLSRRVALTTSACTSVASISTIPSSSSRQRRTRRIDGRRARIARTAFALATMTAVARLPKTGKHRWSSPAALSNG
jgi:hypothetical protein